MWVMPQNRYLIRLLMQPVQATAKPYLMARTLIPDFENMITKHLRQLWLALAIMACSLPVAGQPLAPAPLLTLEEALKTALENNYDIRISANQVEQARSNVHIGNAGYLPFLGGTFNSTNDIENTQQIRSNGQNIELNGVKSSVINYGVNFNWTIFNGFAMFARYDQLKALQKLGEANLQATVLMRVSDVISTYYDLVQQQQQLRAYDTALAISRLRVETAQVRFQIGKAARLEVLNAQVDLNTDTTNLLRQQELYRNTRVLLNELLARDLTTAFRVADSVTINTNLRLEDLTSRALAQNPNLQAVQVSKRIAELDLKQVRALRYPEISLNSGYNVRRSRTPAGFTTRAEAQGFTYGVSASFNIFNGLVQRRNERTAELLIQNSQLEYQRLSQNLSAQLAAAYQTYQTNLTLVRLEENNQRIAKQNLDITLEKYRLGTLTTVEFRDAQLNYLNATVRYANAQYQAKLAEVALQEIAGDISL